MKMIDFLNAESAKYEITQHSPTFTAQQMAAQEHIPGMEVAKPVVVKADDRYYMCVIPACRKVDWEALKGQLKAGCAELADESEMAGLFDDCALGAEPPFGNLYGLETLMDKTLEADEYIVFQGGTHDKAIRMEMSEYKRLVEPKILNFSYQAE